MLTDETGITTALVSADPIFGLLRDHERTFGALPSFRPVRNGSAQLSYFIYSCTASNPNPSPRSSSRHHARADLRPSVLCIRSTMSNSQRTSRRRKPPIPILNFLSFSRDQETGGAERDRTDDLLLAKQALSQLSYGPTLLMDPSSWIRRTVAAIGSELALAKLVGQGRFELPTSRLSSARSNQLSYQPRSGDRDQKSGVRTCLTPGS